MRVCILKESLTIGGNERSAANTTKALCGCHDVVLALYDGSQIKYSYEGKLCDFSLPPKPSFIGKVLNTFLRDRKLRKLLKKEKIDILYTFTTIGNRQTGYQYKPIKIISARDFGKMKSEPHRYRAALQNSDAMICNSQYTKDYYLSKYPEDRDKVYTVYNYINIDEIKGQAKEMPEQAYLEFVEKHPHTVVSVGRFCKEKGFEHLIEAFAKARQSVSDMGLVLVGDGEYRSKYEQLICGYGLEEHVYMTGFQANPYQYMARCDAFVLSSLSEGFPNVLAEAMALELPVIACNCYSGPAEILREDQNYDAAAEGYEECDFGILVPRLTEEDPAHGVNGLSQAIVFLAENDEKRSYYIKKSKVRVEDFSMQAMTERLNVIFNELSGRRTVK